MIFFDTKVQGKKEKHQICLFVLKKKDIVFYSTICFMWTNPIITNINHKNISILRIGKFYMSFSTLMIVFFSSCVRSYEISYCNWMLIKKEYKDNLRQHFFKDYLKALNFFLLQTVKELLKGLVFPKPFLTTQLFTETCY